MGLVFISLQVFGICLSTRSFFNSLYRAMSTCGDAFVLLCIPHVPSNCKMGHRKAEATAFGIGEGQCVCLCM